MEINEKKRRLTIDRDKDKRKLESSASEIFEKLCFRYKGEAIDLTAAYIYDRQFFKLTNISRNISS